MSRLARGLIVVGLLVPSLCCVSAIAGSIPVVVDRPLPDTRPGAPVKFGVPFPEGALKVGEAVQVVDDQGKAVASQSLVTATWDPKGEKGVRWMLIDFLADEGRLYRLLYGKDLLAAAVSPPPIAQPAEGHIALNTGVLSGPISTSKADLFVGLKTLGGAPAVLPDGDKRFCAFFVEHEKKGLFRSDLDPTPSVVIEETGPIRATVKLDGWYANAAGEKFCRYSIRAHFFRGRSDVRLDHTFIYTGLSKDDRIRSMGLQLPQKSGQRIHIWGEGNRQDDLLMIQTSNARVVCDSPDRDRIELLNYPPEGAPRKLAGRALGTVNSGSITAAIRDAWQQYPWGFEVRDGVLQVQLWPRGERLLDTTFDGYWWFMDERQKRFMLSGKRGATTEPPDDWIARFRRVVNATGAAKTHEVWLTFDFPDVRGSRSEMSAGLNGGKLMREVDHPVVACADPAWSTATRALDFCAHTPRNDALFGDEERYLDAMLAMVHGLTEASHWYGWWEWGGYYQLPGRPRGAFRDTHDQDAWQRNRPKSHYGWGQLPWLQYFRTGDRKWLRYGQTYTLYSADRAHVHHTGNGRIAGSEYHYDNSEIPWLGGYVKPGGPETSSNLQQKDDYVYMYWLTGDRRALDVLKTWGEQLGENPSTFTWAPGMAAGNDIRNAGMQLHRLMMLYQATWDERFLKVARGVADSFAVIDSEKQVILAEGDRKDPKYSGWRFHTAGGWAYEGLWLYYNVTKDPRLKQTLLAFIERSKNFDSSIGWGYGPIRAFTYGYELTSDGLYLDMIRAILDDVAAGWVSPASWVTGSKFTVVSMGRALGTLAGAPQAWKETHLPTNVRGRTLRFGYVPLSDSRPGDAAFFNKTRDRAWSFRLVFSHGGRWTLRRPDGQVAYESPMLDEPFDVKWLDVQVPADGQTGTYTLRCTQPSKAGREVGGNRNADARVLRSDLPVVTSAHDVFGRSLFFRPAQAPAHVTVTATTAVAALVPLAPRVLELYADGKPIASAAGLLPSYMGAWRLSIPAGFTGKVVELRPEKPADKYFADAPGDCTVHRYAAALKLEGIPPYLAANPEDCFAPEAPK